MNGDDKEFDALDIVYSILETEQHLLDTLHRQDIFAIVTFSIYIETSNGSFSVLNVYTSNVINEVSALHIPVDDYVEQVEIELEIRTQQVSYVLELCRMLGIIPNETIEEIDTDYMVFHTIHIVDL